MKTKLILGGLTLVAVGLSVALSGERSEAEAGYVLHEWGTFTTVSGSDGVLLNGLEREEEHLPTFVYSHVGMEHGTRTNPGRMVLKDGKEQFQPEGKGIFDRNALALSKGMWRRQLRNVAVKMETPVVYFYADEEVQVDLKVGFKGGAISQWFPHRWEGEVPPKIDQLYPVGEVKGKPAPPMSEQEKAMGIIDFAHDYDGWVRWKLDVLPRESVDPVKLFRAGETPTWLYPKVRDAAVVRNHLGEHEDYLFYRGVGNFGQPVTFLVDEQEQLHIRNDSELAVPFALVFERRGGLVRFKTLGSGVAGDAEVVIPEGDLAAVSGDWKEEIYVPMRDGLVAAGLFPDEADGMVRTWWKSYFQSDGLRVFWVVPERVTEAILPMEVTPAPRKSVRVIVGRSEVLRPRFEQELVDALTSNDKEKEWQKNRFLTDRFGLAYQERVKELTKEREVAKR